MAKKQPKQPIEEPAFNFENFDFKISHDFRLTKKQKDLLKVAHDPDTKMVILDGVPGTGKTVCSMLIGLEKIKRKDIGGITSFRSTVMASDGQTGFLPGEWPDKGQFIGAPFHQKMDELVKPNDKEVINKNLFDFLPTSFIRSYSFKNECLILSEAQNCRFDSIFDVACRAGEGCFVVVEGDTIMQNDIGKASGFKQFCNMFNDEESQKHGIYYFHFGPEDIVRSDFVQYLVEKRLKEQVSQQ